MTQEMDAVRLERLLPSEIRRALNRRSVVYVPLGTYEWHGEHLPIGLDGLTAHGLCTHAARQDGGLVCPTLYYGTGGSHGGYDWSIMVDAGEIAALIAATLSRLQQFGVETAIVVSGHFAGEQIDMLKAIQGNWLHGNNRMRVRTLAVNMAEGLALRPDHAGMFETTLLGALWPDRVRTDLLPPLERAPSIDPGGEMGPQRHDPQHPLFGIFGPDPRRYDAAAAPALLQSLVEWLVGEVRATNAATL